jgi:hypothetical protein
MTATNNDPFYRTFNRDVQALYVHMRHGWLVGWLVGWSAGWLVGWLHAGPFSILGIDDPARNGRGHDVGDFIFIWGLFTRVVCVRSSTFSWWCAVWHSRAGSVTLHIPRGHVCFLHTLTSPRHAPFLVVR